MKHNHIVANASEILTSSGKTLDKVIAERGGEVRKLNDEIIGQIAFPNTRLSSTTVKASNPPHGDDPSPEYALFTSIKVGDVVTIGGNPIGVAQHEMYPSITTIPFSGQDCLVVSRTEYQILVTGFVDSGRVATNIIEFVFDNGAY